MDVALGDTGRGGLGSVGEWLESWRKTLHGAVMRRQLNSTASPAQASPAPQAQILPPGTQQELC